MSEQKWDLFISYAREGKTSCDELVIALKRHGYSAWIDDDAEFDSERKHPQASPYP